MRKVCNHCTELLKKKLSKSFIESHKCLIGFDGFIDTLYEVVSQRKNSSSFTPIPTIYTFGTSIKKAAKKSTNFELVSKCTKIGGNGPILAEACTSFSLKPFLIGTLGVPTPHPIFIPLVKKLQKYFSIGNPGYTDALEFSDGKIILGKHACLHTLDEKKMFGSIKKKYFEDLTFFASVNWTMLFITTKLWRFLQKEIFIHLKNPPKMIFVDLADPAKREKKDLKEALSVLKNFKSPVTLGLNELEARRLLALYKIPEKDSAQWSEGKAKDIAEKLLKKTGLHRIFIHTTTCGAIATEKESFSASGYFIKNPKITTGGGDNCNGGFLFAKSLGICDELALHIALWTASYYVQNKKSPTLTQLKKWFSQFR